MHVTTVNIQNAWLKLQGGRRPIQGVLLWAAALLLSVACGGQAVPPAKTPPSPSPGAVAPQVGSTPGVFTAINFVNPFNPNLDYPALQPWIFENVVTHRFNYNDMLYGATINVDYQHGGSNFMGMDTNLKPRSVDGNFENISALTLNLTANTDVQGGGTLDLRTNHYGHGDTVMFTSTTNATGGSRGSDEHNRVFRVFSQFHGNNYGIRIATLTTDPLGEAILTAQKNGDGTPEASPGHDLRASMENGPLLNTNPAKVYTAGNVAEVEICADRPPSAKSYMCVTGDAATGWTTRYGISRLTTLAADISDRAPDPTHRTAKIDAFAAGPVCLDVSVANASIFKVGGLFTISSAGDNFEQPTVLAVGRTTMRACFAKPHAAGEILSTGGAVGHALSFRNDDMAPHTVPGVDNQNESSLRLGYPIVASLAGDVLMVWVDAAGNGGQPELKSRSFAASIPVLSAAFTPVLDPVTHGIAAWTIQSNGDYHTRSKTHEGADILPPPTVSFSHSACTVLPVAHTVYTVVNGSQVSIKPVTDKPGNCSSLQVSLQQAYPNPASIYPMLWARSNRDPNFVESRYLRDIGMGASTNGYMVAGGLSPEFSAGDPIEFGYWWQQYVTSDITLSSWMNKSKAYGSYFNINFDGVYGEAMLKLRNYTNQVDYWGTFENGFNPGLHGEGRMQPPVGFEVSGPVKYGLVMQVPRPRAGTAEDVGGLRFYCGSGPCSHGIWNTYDWINAEGKDHDQAGFRYDPDAFSLTFYERHNGLFTVPAGIATSSIRSTASDNAVSIDHAASRDGKGALRLGTIQPTGIPDVPCDPGHRFTQNPVAGSPGVADSYRVCLKDAQDRYAWHTLGIVN